MQDKNNGEEDKPQPGRSLNFRGIDYPTRRFVLVIPTSPRTLKLQEVGSSRAVSIIKESEGLKCTDRPWSEPADSGDLPKARS